MSYIWILSKPQGSTVLPRPYNMASHQGELVEMIGRKPGDVDLKCISTDKPVLISGGTEFFAFSAPF